MNSNLTNVFSSEFVKSATDVLEDACKDNRAITKVDVCKALGLTETCVPVIELLIESGTVPGFDIKKGRGIGRVGVQARRAAVPSTTLKKPRSFDVSDDFKVKVLETLNKMVPENQNRGVPRKLVAEELGLSRTKEQMMLVDIINSSEDFALRVGKLGGIFRTTTLLRLEHEKREKERRPKSPVKDPELAKKIEDFIKANAAKSSEDFPSEEELLQVAEECDECEDLEAASEDLEAASEESEEDEYMDVVDDDEE